MAHIDRRHRVPPSAATPVIYVTLLLATAASCSSDCPPVRTTAEEISSTPREDTNLEQLAVRLSPGIVARQDIYDRLVKDVYAARAAVPDVATVKYWPLEDGRTLQFDVDVPTLEAMRDNRYNGWKCVNDAYGVESIDAQQLQSMPPSLPHHPVLLKLKGIYALDRLATEYQAVLTTGSVKPLGTTGDGPTICVTRKGELWHYVFSVARGDCAAGCYATTAYYFTSKSPGGSPELQGKWDSESGTSAPTWWTDYGEPAGSQAACPQPS